MALNEKLTKPYLMGVQGYKGGKAASSLSTNNKVFKLSSNENPIGPSPKAMQAAQQAAQSLHIYPDNTPARLYEALGNYYDDLTADHFVAGNSGSEMIELLMTAFVREGDEVIISNPSFLPYQMFSEWRGARAVDIPLLAPDYRLDTQAVLAAINDRTRIIFLTTPNNPTATHIPKAEIDKIVAAMPTHCVLAIDEVYYRFADAADYTTAQPYVLDGKQVIGINSFSKSYGLAGLRLGYMYTTPALAAYIRGAVRPFLINSIGLAAAIAALDDEAWVDSVVSVVQAQKQRLYPVMEELGLKHWPSQANFILTKPKMGELPFVEAMQNEGIMTRPVTSFGAPDCVRISIGDAEATDALIAALRKVLG